MVRAMASGDIFDEKEVDLGGFGDRLKWEREFFWICICRIVLPKILLIVGMAGCP